MGILEYIFLTLMPITSFLFILCPGIEKTYINVGKVKFLKHMLEHFIYFREREI